MTWIVIDGTNYAYKYFCAAPDKAASLFEYLLDSLVQMYRFDRVAVCFDLGSPNRSLLYPEYKADRPERPDGIDEILEAFRLSCYDRAYDVVEVEGYEADDCIATIAAGVSDRVVIASGDKDMHQALVDGRVSILKKCNHFHGELICKWMTASSLVKEHGLRPDQWIDYQTLIGDVSDNIPGCVGIGPKTAKRILAAGSLEDFYRDPFRAQVTEKVRDKLLQFRTRDLMRSLVTLDTNVPTLTTLWETT